MAVLHLTDENTPNSCLFSQIFLRPAGFQA
jgi:hypothetical protein